MPKTVVFVHSYCLAATDDKRLTQMSQKAIETGVTTMKERKSDALVVSASYGTANCERELYTKYATHSGIYLSQIHALIDVTNSYNEASQAVSKALELKAEKLVVVAEKWHAVRSKKVFQSICPSGLQLEVVPFNTPRYEFTLEPSAIKKYRTGFAWSWILWNKLLGALPASLLERVSGNVH